MFARTERGKQVGWAIGKSSRSKKAVHTNVYRYHGPGRTFKKVSLVKV